MKHLATALLAVIGLSVAGQIASAADLPMKAPPMVAAPVPFSWTGFYVGAHIGGGWGTKEWSNVCDPTGVGGCFTPRVASDGTVSGFLGGLQAGYNFQVDRLVLGVEGDFSWANISGSNLCFVGAATCSSKADWLGTLTGRIGGAFFDRALLYVKGGAAWVNDSYNEYCPVCGNGPAYWTGGQTRSGWTLGAGVEYAFTRNWSGKVEYNYMDFGTKNGLHTSTTPGILPYKVDILQRIDVVKAGVNYRF